jgi:hypothetical protein
MKTTACRRFHFELEGHNFLRSLYKRLQYFQKTLKFFYMLAGYEIMQDKFRKTRLKVFTTPKCILIHSRFH